MLEVFLMAILGAAAIADQERTPPPVPPPSPPRPPEDEAMKLLGIGQPELDETERGIEKKLKFKPWTLEQITSFQKGQLMCPRGHTKEFTYIELDYVLRRMPRTHTQGGLLDIQGFYSSSDGSPEVKGWLICETCSDEFWFPDQWITVDFI